MAETSHRELFESYRFHAELADRASRRREGANRLFVSLLAGLMVFLVALLHLGTRDWGENALMFFFGIAGAMLSTVWFVVVKALHELERHMPHAFLQREWELLRTGRDFRRYWRLTVVETSLPILFFSGFSASSPSRRSADDIGITPEHRVRGSI